ncbi:MAG: hypothetical protein ACI9VR_000702 [Cognaticolwellia sp.]|jgi:hypothetical protein
MLLLLVTLSAAAPAPVAERTSSQDYADGYALGTAHAQNVAVAEWGLYGAASSCVGPIGCVGVMAGAMLVDPSQLRPLLGKAPVPQVELGNLPPAPSYVLHSETWAQGYEAGWDKRVRRRRTSWAVAGGAALPAMAATAYFTVVGAALWSTNNP